MREAHCQKTHNYCGHPINNARIKAAISVAELCHRVGICSGVYYALMNGEMLPVNSRGKLHPWIHKLMDELGAFWTDFWPEFERTNLDGMLEEQLVSLCHPELLAAELSDPEMILMNREKQKAYARLFSRLKERDQQIIIAVLSGKTMSALARERNVTPAYIGQLFRNAMQKIQYYVTTYSDVYVDYVTNELPLTFMENI